MQGKGYLGIVFEHVQEGAIAGAIGLFEDPVEITHGLVVMKRENQADLRHVEPLRCGRRRSHKHGGTVGGADRTVRASFATTALENGPGIGGGDVDLSQETGRVLGRNRVDVKARAPLEARDLRQTRNHLDVPMVMRQFAMVKRGRVDDVVVSRAVERKLQLAQRPDEAPDRDRPRPA